MRARQRGIHFLPMTTAVLLVALSACGTPPPALDTGTAAATQQPAPADSPTAATASGAATPDDSEPGEIPAPAERTPGSPARSTPAEAAAPPAGTPTITASPSASTASATDSPSTAPSSASSGGASRASEPAELGDPSAVTVVVNKRRPLDPIDYSPAGLVLPAVPLAVQEPNALLRSDTAAAVEQLFAAAANDGVGLTLVSGYRSYQDQVSTYEHWVAQHGGDTAAADRISARAGFSEHQTGLAFDIGQSDGACTLSSCFADTAAGRWMAANAHRFGFILRYPNGAQDITGFSGESWHYRYVGVDIAQAMRSTGLPTLEQYFGLPPAPGY